MYVPTMKSPNTPNRITGARIRLNCKEVYANMLLKMQETVKKKVNVQHASEARKIEKRPTRCK